MFVFTIGATVADGVSRWNTGPYDGLPRPSTAACDGLGRPSYVETMVVPVSHHCSDERWNEKQPEEDQCDYKASRAACPDQVPANGKRAQHVHEEAKIIARCAPMFPSVSLHPPHQAKRKTSLSR